MPPIGPHLDPQPVQTADDGAQSAAYDRPLPEAEPAPVAEPAVIVSVPDEMTAPADSQPLPIKSKPSPAAIWEKQEVTRLTAAILLAQLSENMTKQKISLFSPTRRVEVAFRDHTAACLAQSALTLVGQSPETESLDFLSKSEDNTGELGLLVFEDCNLEACDEAFKNPENGEACKAGVKASIAAYREKNK